MWNGQFGWSRSGFQLLGGMLARWRPRTGNTGTRHNEWLDGMVPFVVVRHRFAVSTPAEEPPGRLRGHTVQPVRPGEERSHAGVPFEEVYVSNDGELGVGLVADQVP